MATLPPEAQARRAELPTPNSTDSYWHREPSKTLLNHRTTKDTPNTADIVVVGSGISGAFAARELVAGGRSVVMLEAREACWGATGRNGGHCQPAVWDSTVDVARFELATFQLVRKLIEEHKVPCDFHIPGGIHAIYSQEILEAAEKQIKRLQKHEDLKNKAVLILDREELAARNVPEALGAVFQPYAAKLWPYKLVAWVLERLLDEHDAATFNLQTHTPLTRLERRGSSWVAHTPRGEIRAQEVLLATNAYTSYVLPGLTDVIVPVRGQVCALEPPPGATQLPHSYVWTKEAGDNYLVHRWFDDLRVEDGPSASTGVGTLILGGERFAVPEGEEGISRDDTINPIISHALHRGLNHAVKLLPGDEPEKEALRAAYEWTGIMGYSRDSHPWVGRVPGTLLGDANVETGADGLWISAGFTGHGMPVAPGSGIAVAQMILGKESGAKVPEAWTLSEKRIATARSMALPRTVKDLIRSLPAE
ncbi:FAD dependent oxidoreductase [Xylariaceae sp. AK1471]|nr:FAD dependent oxidoreductase [Xylariaceae sp. AK1471]